MFDPNKVESEISNAVKKLKEFAAQLDSGEITWSVFRARVYILMRRLYMATAEIAAKGNLTKELKTLVAQALDEQFYPDDSDFSLAELFIEAEDENVSFAQLTARLVLYLRSARALAYTVYKAVEATNESDAVFAIRELKAGAKHCMECLLYASLPPQPLSAVIVPGHFCRCFSNCQCRIVETPPPYAVR